MSIRLRLKDLILVDAVLMLLIYKRIGRQCIDITISNIMNYKNKDLLTIAFIDRLKANLIKLGTIRLTNNSKVSLTSTNYLSILITLDHMR